MVNLYVIDDQSAGVLRSKYLLLDTNFIIDALIFRAQAIELIERFRDLACELITTPAVITEFLGGTKDKGDFEAKVRHLEILFGKPLAKIVSLVVGKDFPAQDAFLAFSRQCNKFGTTDFELYLTLKKFSTGGLLLVTRNHSDFTNKICDRVGFITLLGNKEIRTYGMYQAL